MKLIIAPSASGKTHFLKSLVAEGKASILSKANPQDPSDNTPTFPGGRKHIYGVYELLERSIEGELVRLYDGDHLPEVRGVYKAMDREYGPKWWEDPKHRPAKKQLMSRAWGNVIARMGRNAFIFTAERIVQRPTRPFQSIVVLPTAETLVENSKARESAGSVTQPLWNEGKALETLLAYSEFARKHSLTAMPDVKSALSYALHEEKADYVKADGKVGGL